MFTDPDTYILFRNSLIYALATVTISLSIGIVLVWLIERTDLPAKELVLALVLLPMAIPGMVKAIGWAMLANPNLGVLNSFLRELFGLTDRYGPLNVYSLGGMIFVSALSHVPSVTLMIAGAFRSFDPSLEEAALMSGAEWRQHAAAGDAAAVEALAAGCVRVFLRRRSRRLPDPGDSRSQRRYPCLQHQDLSGHQSGAWPARLRSRQHLFSSLLLLVALC